MNPHTKKGYWVPVDAALSESDYIPNSTIKDKIEDINAKHIFLVSDSCFSGTFLTKTRSVDIASSFYEKLDKSKSRWYLSSGREEKVSDGIKGKGSPFSNSLINFLKENDSKYISVSEIINHTSKITGSASRQQPVGGTITGLEQEYGQMILIKKEHDIKLTQQQFNNFMKTYGFYYGQKYSIELIKSLYPLLGMVATLRQMQWENVFASSVENILYNTNSKS
ncbi:hypothetical protein FHK02_6096 [Spirosoma sp. LMG 31448]|nr:hypothetical protein [Spirosoma utsteinense]